MCYSGIVKLPFFGDLEPDLAFHLRGFESMESFQIPCDDFPTRQNQGAATCEGSQESLNTTLKQKHMQPYHSDLANHPYSHENFGGTPPQSYPFFAKK